MNNQLNTFVDIGLIVGLLIASLIAGIILGSCSAILFDLNGHIIETKSMRHNGYYYKVTAEEITKSEWDSLQKRRTNGRREKLESNP